MDSLFARTDISCCAAANALIRPSPTERPDRYARSNFTVSEAPNTNVDLAGFGPRGYANVREQKTNKTA
jgi:hypothetical protein